MEKVICAKCPAVFDGGRWVFNPHEHLRLKDIKVKESICPGCKRIERQYIEGVVSLKGEFLRKHKTEALNLIRHIAEDYRSRNVAARIYNLRQEEEGIFVETTDLPLAERIGKEFVRAFSGSLEINWLKDARFVRVTWKR
jgi:NMD protein affecting ribosome stability and mRNA decay